MSDEQKQPGEQPGADEQPDVRRRADEQNPPDVAKRDDAPAPSAQRVHAWEHRCDLCGAAMKEWHCRIICNFCGYQRDCSDP